MATIDSIGTQINQAATNNLIGQNTLGKQDFLNLLVTQLKYQDPLNPMENTEFVTQLSQFSSLEQLWNLNETLQADALLSQSMHNSLVASLIGKEVKALGNVITLPEAGEVSLNYNISERADVKITIFDESGNLVRSFDIGKQDAGNHSTTWNGKDDFGNSLSTGEYVFQVIATDSDGDRASANTFLRGQISGIRFVEGSPILLMGNLEIELANILEIVLPESN